MFFGNGVSEPFIGLLETHPPLTDRIRVFDPNFDGKFPVVRYDGRDQPPEEILKPETAADAKHFRHGARRRNSRVGRRGRNRRSSGRIPSCQISAIPRRCIWNTPSNCAIRCPTA